MLARRRVLFAGALAGTAAWATLAIPRRVRAARFVSALGTGAGRASGLGVATRDVVLPDGGTGVRARVYRPAQGGRFPGIVVAHGVHYRGIEERRLVPFARTLAATGRVVLTPELADLTDYRISAQGKDVIVRAARWLSERSELVEEPRVGVLGFSFAGGLALVAAASPKLEERLAFVTSVGGHHDLGRVLGFLLADRIATPSGLLATPAHEYGLVILLYQYLEAFIVPGDQAAFREALRAWLHEDRAQARALAQETSESTQRIFELLETRRLKELAPELRRQIDAEGARLRELSPSGRLSRVQVPVYLLHGAGDSVIPPSETDWAARELGARAHAALVSPLIEHVELNHEASLRDELALVEFMANMF